MAGFGEKLQAEMDARGMGARTLARLLDPGNVEQERRSIRRYLGGMTPQARNRNRIEDALGLERGALEPDADEEDSLTIALLGRVQESLDVPEWCRFSPELARLRGMGRAGADIGEMRDEITALDAARAVGRFFWLGARLPERDGGSDNLLEASPAFPSRSESREVAA